MKRMEFTVRAFKRGKRMYVPKDDFKNQMVMPILKRKKSDKARWVEDGGT